MLIRIFAFRDVGIDKYLNFLRLEQGGGRTWNIEYCDPMKWTPQTGDIHIYVDIPLRIAVPWAKFNVYFSKAELSMWDWTKKEMDLILSADALKEKTSALAALRRMLKSVVKGQHPPMLPIEPEKGTIPPKVGIITITRNRKDWWVNMLQNVVKQDWPVSRVEWIIVDDGDEDQRLRGDVEEFMEKSPGIMIRYVEMATVQTVGAKRNAAVEAAGEDVTVFVSMDDDDHYPSTSIRQRVAWLNRSIPLTKTKDKEKDKEKQLVQSQVGYCSVLPMYDLTRYISAINVPELELGPAERVSEATLVFTREAWAARPFPDVNMAEGLGFLEEREDISVEMPSKGVIVSFIHTKNSSSRRIPKEEEPNGCHYGFSDEFFKYVHQIGGGQS